MRCNAIRCDEMHAVIPKDSMEIIDDPFRKKKPKDKRQAIETSNLTANQCLANASSVRYSSL